MKKYLLLSLVVGILISVTFAFAETGNTLRLILNKQLSKTGQKPPVRSKTNSLVSKKLPLTTRKHIRQRKSMASNWQATVPMKVSLNLI